MYSLCLREAGNKQQVNLNAICYGLCQNNFSIQQQIQLLAQIAALGLAEWM